MKNIYIILSFLLITGYALNAQQAKPSHLLIVTIHAGQGAYHPEMIVTKEDGTQEITMAKKGSWMWEATSFDTRDGKIAANEDSLFQTLKPFIASGWKLTTSYVLHEGSGNDDYIARYFFTKED